MVETLNDFLRIVGDGARVVGGIGVCALMFGTDTVLGLPLGDAEVDVDVDVDVAGKRN